MIRRSRRSAGRDAGMVTAETAVVLPVFVLLLLAGVAVISAALTQLRCLDAAQTVARLVARGVPTASAVASIRTQEPAADVDVRRVTGTAPDFLDWVVVTVSLPVPAVPRLHVLPAARVSESAQAPLEPVAAPAP